MPDSLASRNIRDLKDLPHGTEVFVDTNIFHYHFERRSDTCTAFLLRVAQREITAYVNVQILSDLLHKLMLAEAVNRHYVNDDDAGQLKRYLGNCRTNAQGPRLEDYQTQFENILKIGLRVLPMNENLLKDTIRERKKYYLMVGDSLHLGTMNRRRVKNREVPLQHIVTHDKDFMFVPDLTIWKPFDIVLRAQASTPPSLPASTLALAPVYRNRNAHP
ncbi:MAG TPA: type II toxin-antitoxin system VapC family toxin [Ktedonobacteraceae bacterium]|nr:type II toxin-antitoxin system VapC family toxin [Ktedonobacteraceae bacterium]